MVKNQKGFAVIEVVLAVLLFAAIGFAGYFAYEAHKNGHQSTSAAVTSSSKPTRTSTASAIDPTAKWIGTSVPAGGFSFKYKPGWYVTGTSCDPNPSQSLINPTKLSCDESEFRMTIAAHKGDVRNDNYGAVGELVGDKLNKAEKVTVDGVQGMRYELIATKELELAPPVKGETYIVYNFYTQNKTFAAMYEQHPSDPDLSSDFDLMVTKTLKFSS